MSFMPEEFLMPNYGNSQQAGTTIANVPATVARLLDIPFDGLPSLPAACWQPLEGAKRVVVLVLDALGQNLIDHERERLSRILEQTAVQETITSVFPSTTVNCLSCLWTGRAPAHHGLIGLNLYFPELGSVGQMIHFTPSFGRYPDALVHAGVEPEQFLPVPSVAQQFNEAGVTTYSFKGRELTNSALSRMHTRGVEADIGAITFAHLLCQMRDLLEAKPQERLYLSAYWPTIDTLSHYAKPLTAPTISEMHALFQQIETIFLAGLSAEARKDTCFFIVADHGQLPFNGRTVDAFDPELQQHLLIHNAGEPRVPYLYARQGQRDSLLHTLETTFSEDIIAFPSEKLLDMGLLGPAPFNPAVSLRLGDVTGIMRQGAFFATDPKEKKWFSNFISGHGGLSSDEMLVPWIGFAL